MFYHHTKITDQLPEATPEIHAATIYGRGPIYLSSFITSRVLALSQHRTPAKIVQGWQINH